MGLWLDYLVLCKPRVVLLMLITASVGMYLADPMHFAAPKWGGAMVGIALLGSAAAAINHILDRNLDCNMARTRNRPVANGKISVRRALVFAACLVAGGLSSLYYWVDSLVLSLTVITALGYAVIYTMYLKLSNPQNIVIGGLFGAMPPLLGWAAVSAAINPEALLLVLLIFVWTPMHFWALALYTYQDYLGSGVPMLPITHGHQYTKYLILCYGILTITVSMWIYALGLCAYWYLGAAVCLNIVLVQRLRQLYCSENVYVAAKRLFFYTITYLLLLFIAMLVDCYFITLAHSL